MGRPKYHDKPDQSKADIVKTLRDIGCIVRDDTDTDSKVTHPSWPLNTWMLVEFKTPNRKIKPGVRLRKDQEGQAEFVAAFDVPYLTTPLEALNWFYRQGRPRDEP